MSGVYSVEPLEPAPPSRHGPAPDVPGPDALVCTHCGYPLRGLAASAACPECGAPVLLALRGPILRNAGPEYLQDLHRGVWLILAAIVMWIGLIVLTGGGAAVFVIAGAGVPPWLEPAGTLIGIVPTLMGLAGYWLFTTPDPALSQAEQPRAARRVVRVTTLLQLGGTLLSVGGELLSVSGTVGSIAHVTGRVGGAVQILAWCVQFFAVMRYVEWLARRAPDVQLAGRARTYMWLLPVLSVVVCFLGFLVAMAMYITMMDTVRRHIASAIERSREGREWAAAERGLEQLTTK